MTRQSEIAARRALARRVNDADYVDRRREIVGAAAQVFRDKGFQAANLVDIAAAAGVDRATLYYYVSGKDEVFHAVVRDAVHANVEAVEAIRDREGAAPDKVAAFIERLMQSYADNYPYLFVFVQENLSHLDESTEWNREMRGLARRFDDAVTEIVRAGIADGSLRSEGGEEPRLIAYALIGMCNWSHRWFDPAGRRSPAEIGEMLSGIALRGLGTRAARS